MLSTRTITTQMMSLTSIISIIVLTTSTAAGPAQENRLQPQSIQAIDLPQETMDTLVVPLTLDGITYELALQRRSVRHQNFKVWVDQGGGDLRAVDPPTVRTYEGEVLGPQGGTVAASCRDGQIDAVVWLDDGTIWSVAPLNERADGPQRRLHGVFEGAGDEIDPSMCGTIAPPGPAAPEAPLLPPPTDPVVAMIAFDTDVEFVQWAGGTIEDAVYYIERDYNPVRNKFQALGILHVVTDIIIRTVEPDPYTSTNPATLLTQFRHHWNANHTDIPRNLAQLRSGKDLDGNIIGYAYIGVVCNHTAWAYNLAVGYNQINKAWRLVAHEMGHNWSATHCNGDSDCDIMCSYITGCRSTQHFGNAASTEILDHLSQATCLPPPPCIADLDGNGIVGIEDFLTLLGSWGSSPDGPPDLDGNGVVDVEDFAQLLGNWGPCP